MAESRNPPTIPMVDPIALTELVDKMGLNFVSNLSGYTTSSIRQMVAGNKTCRQAIETLCQLYLDNEKLKEDKEANQEAIYFFSGSDASPQMEATKALFVALKVDLQKL